jgi:3-oxoacyl-[acyl-carrier-protein] synthase-3
MIETREIVIERVAGALGECRLSNSDVASPEVIAATGFPERRVSRLSLFDLSLKAIRSLGPLDGVGAVIAATFSHEVRFPSLAVRIASAVGLDSSAPAFDLQMACSAYPYAVYMAGRLAADMGCKVLVVDGDVQSPFAKSGNTVPVMSDASTATIVAAGDAAAKSRFGFYSKYSEALVCGDEIAMDGMKVFGFVASEVRRLAGEVLAAEGGAVDVFVPHQANMYMVRQLARALKMEDRLVTAGEECGNTGSSSVALALARCRRGERALIAGFGAGLSAAAGTVRLAGNFEGVVA